MVPGRIVQWALVPLLLFLTARFSGADAFDSHLDEILLKTRSGVVRIEARRSWNSLVSDSSRVDSRFAPRLRVTGNGVVWDREGHVVTVSDLAQPGDTLDVITPGGERLRGAFLRQDAEVGLSLIRVDGLASRVQPIERDVSGFHPDREWVLILGAANRRSGVGLSIARVHPQSSNGARSFVFAEGGVGVGSAGGSVLSGDGRLIGILLGDGDESLLLGGGGKRKPIEFALTAIPGPSEAGWIVPIEQVESSVKVLLGMKAGQGFLGVRVDLSSAAKDGPPSMGPGLPIARVLPGSPAEHAGIRDGDLLVGFGGLPVVSWDELTERVAATEPGRLVRVEVIRAGQPAAIEVRLADRGHMIWQQRQRSLAAGRERILRRQIDDFREQLDFLRSQAGPSQ